MTHYQAEAIFHNGGKMLFGVEAPGKIEAFFAAECIVIDVPHGEPDDVNVTEIPEVDKR